jgi:hypothetical protein
LIEQYLKFILLIEQHLKFTVFHSVDWAPFVVDSNGFKIIHLWESVFVGNHNFTGSWECG